MTATEKKAIRCNTCLLPFIDDKGKFSICKFCPHRALPAVNRPIDKNASTTDTEFSRGITFDPVLADNIGELFRLLHTPGAIRSLGLRNKEAEQARVAWEELFAKKGGA